MNSCFIATLSIFKLNIEMLWSLDALIKNFPANHDQYCEVFISSSKKKKMQGVTEIYILNNKELFILQNVFHLFSIAFVNVLHAATTYSKNMICSKIKVLNQFQ